MQEDYEDDDTSNNGTGPRTYYAGPPPSMKESLFMFATVVGSMMGGKSMANLTEALFWAERLMQQNGARGMGDGTANMSTEEKVTMAMAVGSGLKVASNAARMLGMEKSAQTMERTARLAQLASVGAVVAEQPAVQNMLHQGVDSLKKLQSGINAVRAVVNQQRQQQQRQQQQHQEN